MEKANGDEHYLEYIENEVWKVIQNGSLRSESPRLFHKIISTQAFSSWHGMMPKRYGSLQDNIVEKGFDRFQKLLSQLDALGAGVSDEYANHKLRSSTRRQAEGQEWMEKCMWHLIREKLNVSIATKYWDIYAKESASLKGSIGRGSRARKQIHICTFKAKYDELQSEFGNQEAALVAHKIAVNSGTQFKSGASRFNTGKQYVSSVRVNRPVSNTTSPKPSKLLRKWVRIQIIQLILIKYPLLINHLHKSKRRQKQKSKRRQRKEAEVPQDETEHEEKHVLDLEKEKDAQAKEIAALKKRVQRLERKKKSRTTGLKRLKKVGMSRRVESSEDQESLVLDDDEVFVDVTIVEKEEQSTKTNEAVTTAGVGDSAAPTIPTTVEETLAQTLMEIKTAKPKAKEIVFSDQEEQKDQVAIDEDLARNIQAQLDAEIIEEERLERQKLLAERLQTREREELTDEKKGKLFMELMGKRKKHFAELRAQEKRNRHPTRAQKRTQMSTYSIWKKEDGNEEKAKGNRKKMLGRKRARKEQQQESSKKQRMEEDKETDEVEEVEEDDEAELKKHLVIKQDDDIAIDVIPLATKPPVIVDYKLLKEGIMVHYQLIRADGSSKRYSSMIRMLQGIDREDLLTLWKLVKTKHGDIRPEDDHERVMWGDFKVMFEPDIRSKVWRDLQGYTVSVWKLYDSCGVHFARFGNVHIFMLVEKRYPLTPITITNMLNKKLQTDHFNEMCYQLLKLMVKQQKGQ
ncbi:hypothetical protein Tco_1247474 [Tanacetum coccineum]